ncbi:hypothetical protein [Streptomyces sp. NPDC050264]|uniref:hypothetical protein n=1 Tax=Streptomyces sp. NPDC050264 TaxID=3155038 RepID=UPI003435FBAB
MYLAADTSGAVFGVLGSGGIALCLTVLLIFGIVGGRLTFRQNGAAVCAFIAGTTYVSAGKIWANPGKVVEQGLTGLGVGAGSGPFGDVGIGAVSLLLAIILVACPAKWLPPGRAAIVAMIAAFVWPAAGDGSIWAMPVQFAAAVLMMVGA